MEVGGDELTAYDNLNPRTRERIWGDLCRGPHAPTTKYIPAFKLTRSSAATGAAIRTIASLQRIYGTAWESQEALDRHLRTAGRGGARATTAGSASNSTCSASPTRSVRGCRCSIPRAASCAGSWRSTPGASTSRPATSSSTPRISPRSSSTSPPATSSGTPTACSRRCTSTPSTPRTARCASPGRTTTSSR